MNKLYVVFIVLSISVFVVGYNLLVKPEPEQKTTEQIKKSVVRIRAENQMNGEKREGTGFVVGVSDDKAYIVTVSHVVEGDPNPTVEFFENNEFEAEILDNESQENGLALLSVKGQPYDVMPLYLVKKRNLNSGDALFTIGFPRGGARWAHDELSYSGKKRRNIIFSGSNEREGNSGSPVIKGEQVVAIITSITDYAYAISAESTREFLDGAKGGKPVIDNMEKWKPSKWSRSQEARLENAKFVINKQARLKEIELKIVAATVRLREAEAKVAIAEQASLQAEAEVKLIKADAKTEAKLVAAKQNRKQAEIEVAQAKVYVKKAERQYSTELSKYVITKSDIQPVFNGFIAAWNNRQLEQLTSNLSSDFYYFSVNEGKVLQYYDKYVANKKQLFKKYSWISVDVSNVRYNFNGNEGTVTFNQHFNSPSYESKGMGKLYFRKVRGRTKIFRTDFNRDWWNKHKSKHSP